jgi:LacI family transcriptional regulator
MVDVAVDAGVSLKTVSRVINGVRTVDPEMVERVHASIARLGFRRNTMAANLRSGSRDTIGLVTADLSNTFYTTIARAVSAVAIEQNIQVLMASTDEDPALEQRIVRDMTERSVGGLIVVPSGPDQDALELERRRGTAIVLLDRPAPGVNADAVLIDNRGGARDAVAELLAAGHRRIAVLLDSLSIHTMSERREGAFEAFAAAGVAVQDHLVVTDMHAPDPARAAMEKLIEIDDPPTAVFCGNNRITIGALEAILPRNAPIAVTGFDDFEAAHLLSRGIRLVDYDADLLGRTAAQQLLARITGDDSPPRTTYIPTRLVDRGSFDR